MTSTNTHTRGEGLPFAIIDVFAQTPLTGNPLAVVMNAERLDEDSMRAIALEFNLSETTFILPPTLPDALYRLRSFTMAGSEVFGAGGHNTLGAWLWLAMSGRLDLTLTETMFVQEIGNQSYPLIVMAQQNRPIHVVMDQSTASWGETTKDLHELAAALGLREFDLAMDGPPVQVVNTGAAHLMVPLRNRAVVDAANPDVPALRRVLELLRGEGCYVFSLDPPHPSAQVYARFFNPTMGIVEDPATGTAAGPLAAHLVRYGFAQPGQFTIEQGTRMGRMSLLEVETDGSDTRIHGAGTLVAEGVLYV